METKEKFVHMTKSSLCTTFWSNYLFILLHPDISLNVQLMVCSIKLDRSLVCVLETQMNHAFNFSLFYCCDSFTQEVFHTLYCWINSYIISHSHKEIITSYCSVQGYVEWTILLRYRVRYKTKIIQNIFLDITHIASLPVHPSVCLMIDLSIYQSILSVLVWMSIWSYLKLSQSTVGWIIYSDLEWVSKFSNQTGGPYHWKWQTDI